MVRGADKNEISNYIFARHFYFADPSYVSKLLLSQPMVSGKRSFLSFEMFHSTIY